MKPSNVFRMRRQPPDPDDLIKVIRRLAHEGKFAFIDDDAGDAEENTLDVPNAVEVLKHGSIDGPIEQGASAGEWECRVVSNLSLRGSYAAVQTVVVRKERLVLKGGRWID